MKIGASDEADNLRGLRGNGGHRGASASIGQISVLSVSSNLTSAAELLSPEVDKFFRDPWACSDDDDAVRTGMANQVPALGKESVFPTGSNDAAALAAQHKKTRNPRLQLGSRVNRLEKVVQAAKAA